MPNGDSFLPRIQSVFYAIFDETTGPKIVYQVPEGLIAPPSQAQVPDDDDESTVSSPSSTERSVDPLTPSIEFPSRASSSSLVSPTDFTRRGRQFPSPHKQSISSQRTLFNFSEISMYVIPPPSLCGRLVVCSTRRHRVIGFPVELTGPYKRYYFRYNICFVFDRNADLSCYEPVVRKISRVLRSCEQESYFLSSDQTSPLVHGILEQLYEDLNSYSETSIAIDQFNSIEVKIFPFYPNPPEVKDWMVPLALINIPKRYEANWDLTMIKVCQHIDGVNHVARISQLADCDIRLTRQAIAHLLYYQVIMTIDIFQYSNMYTLCKSVQWLADEMHVKDECGPYVVKPTSKRTPDWPDLLHLYSRFRTGKTVFEWMEEYDVESTGIDVRRFITFGVIKGFLRRVYRYPFFTKPKKSAESPERPQPVYSDPSQSTLMRKRAKSLQAPIPLSLHGYNQPNYDISTAHIPQTSALFYNVSTADPSMTTPPELPSASMRHRARRASQAEKALEHFRARDIQQKTGVNHSPRTSWMQSQHKEVAAEPSGHAHNGYANNGSGVGNNMQGSVANSYASTTVTGASVSTVRGVHDSPVKSYSNHVVPSSGRGRDSRRSSLISPTVPPSSPVLPKMTLTTPSRPRMARSPSYQGGSKKGGPPPYPPQLEELLDGDHHTDEIGVKLGCGWPQLEEWLTIIGGGQGNGDTGNVVIICR